MARGHRPERVGEAIRQVLAEALLGGAAPGAGFVTVTGVQVTKDLRHARVFVSVLGESDDDKETALAALRKHAPQLRSVVARALQTRFTPVLDFRLDHSIERGARVELALREAREQDQQMARLRGEEEARGTQSHLPAAHDPVDGKPR